MRLWAAGSIHLADVITLYPIAPATTGAFYIFNDAQNIKIALQYLAPSPTSTANLEPLFLPKQTSYISTHSKATPHCSPLLLIHLFPQLHYQLPHPQSPSPIPLTIHQQAADEFGGNLLCLGGRRRIGGGAGRVLVAMGVAWRMEFSINT